MKNDYVYDLDLWVSRFPIDQENPTLFGCFGNTTSPKVIAIIEQFRFRILRRYNPGKSIPTDVFSFGLGEPFDRNVTKIGGTPYRPRDKQWPQTESGAPATFLAQFCFTDSKDIVKELPGDILLVFDVNDRGDYWPPSDTFHFEWYDEGITDLVRPEDVPPQSWSFVTCYGVRHRTVDYVDTRFENHPIFITDLYGSEARFTRDALELRWTDDGIINFFLDHGEVRWCTDTL